MSTYIYSGPASGVTLGNGTEVLLWDGKSYDLPAEHAYVKALVARGHLKSAPAQSKPKPKVEK